MGLIPRSSYFVTESLARVTARGLVDPRIYRMETCVGHASPRTNPISPILPHTPDSNLSDFRGNFCRCTATPRNILSATYATQHGVTDAYIVRCKDSIKRVIPYVNSLSSCKVLTLFSVSASYTTSSAMAEKTAMMVEKETTRNLGTVRLHWEGTHETILIPQPSNDPKAP